MWLFIVVFGLAAGLFDPDWPPAEALLLLAVLACLLLKRQHNTLGVLILAYLYANVYLALSFHGLFPERLAGQDIIIQGQVAEVLRHSPEQQQLRFQVTTCYLSGSGDAADRPADLSANPHCDFTGTVVLNRYMNRTAKDRLLQKPADPLLQQGERWRLKVRLYPLRGFVNPGQSRYRLQQLAKGIMARGYVRDEGASLRLAQAPAWQQQVEHWRGWVDRQQRQFSDVSGLALVPTLITGRSDRIRPQQWSLLQATGTLHLVVVSGLHIGVLLGLGWLLMRALPRYLILDRRWQRGLLLMLPVVALLPMLWIWPSGVAVSRALLMAVLILGLRLAGVLLSAWRILALVVLILLLSEPLYLLRPGFYYSVWAVCLLLWVVSGGRHSGLFLRIQLVLLVGLLPIQFFWQNSPDLISGLANLVAIPLVSVVILPLALLLLLLPFEVGLLWLAELERLFWQWLQLCMEMGLGYWSLDPILGLALLFAAVVLALPALPGRRLWLPMLVMLAFMVPEHSVRSEQSVAGGAAKPDAANIEVQVFDVGQGLSVAVRDGDKRLVYDAGPEYRSGFMPIAMVLPPLLRAAAEDIDLLVISHDDKDHAGGAPVLVPLAREVVAGQPGRLNARKSVLSVTPAVKARRCYQGQRWRWQALQIEVLYPPLQQNDGLDDNQHSCVLRVSRVMAPEQSLLLTGDIDQVAERWLLASGQELSARWLIASHHGSASGNSLAFLAAVQPQGVIFSAGYNNSYGHPSVTVQQRLAYLRRQYSNSGRFRSYNTADLGAITLPLLAVSSGVQGQRERLPQRWRWQRL